MVIVSECFWYQAIIKIETLNKNYENQLHTPIKLKKDLTKS